MTRKKGHTWNLMLYIELTEEQLLLWNKQLLPCDFVMTLYKDMGEAKV